MFSFIANYTEKCVQSSDQHMLHVVSLFRVQILMPKVFLGPCMLQELGSIRTYSAPHLASHFSGWLHLYSHLRSHLQLCNGYGLSLPWWIHEQSLPYQYLMSVQVYAAWFFVYFAAFLPSVVHIGPPGCVVLCGHGQPPKLALMAPPQLFQQNKSTEGSTYTFS